VSNFSFNFHHCGTLDSTNDEAIRLAGEGAKEGTVVTADFQTKGRGRDGRIWESVKDRDLLLSIILRPKVPVNRVSGLTLVAAEAVQNTLIFFKISSEIKKPNDVLVDGKKISGILTESQSRGDKIDWCVIGVGLNINSLQEELPEDATSMKLVLKNDTDKERVKSSFLQFLKESYQNY
jgi:BirA family biotin operon repressor/biotin-[acetyl-CoA-carboxylase] ligase